jgi:hypothetical protein
MKRRGKVREFKHSKNPMNRKVYRPSFVTDEMLEYMDTIRDEGANMLGIAPHLEDKYDIDICTARTILCYWFATYLQRHNITSITYDPYFD